MTRNLRNGLYTRMERQEHKLLELTTNLAPEPPMTLPKPIPPNARILETINHPLCVQLEFRL